MKAKTVSAGIVLSATGVGAYLVTVWRRITAGYTTLGYDVVCAVWVASIAILAVALLRCLHATREERKSVLLALSVLIPVITLSGWAWLNLSGRVISHDAMMSGK